jgi:hypothetical protein
MGLQIPATGVTPGPEWMDAIVQSLNILDQHNHSTGLGVPIGSNGLGLTSDLSLSNFSLTTIASLVFSPQSISTLSALYVNGVDLYFNDGNGNTVRMTSGGTVNATSSGISSGTATASFVGGVLVVNAAANTPANIQGASILIGDSIANTKYVTLSAPNALAANYQMFLPASLPATTRLVTLDSAGNIAAPFYIDNTSLTVSSNILGVAPIGQQVSSSSGNFTTSSTSFVDVTNLSVTITTTRGRPVSIQFQPDGSTSVVNPGRVGSSDSTAGASHAYFQILRGATVIAINVTEGGNNASTTSGEVTVPPGVLNFIDYGNTSPGTYTYKLQARAGAVTTIASVGNVKMAAYELP